MTSPNPESNASPLISPPSIIRLDDVTQFPLFEDIVAEDIYPQMNDAQRIAWQGRVAIRDLIRPPKFNGTIRSIELTAMEDPYDRLLDVKERGLTMNNRGRIIPRDDIDAARQATRGFLLHADALSTGKGKIGEIQAELWYMISRSDKYTPTSQTNADKYKRYIRTVATGGSAIERRMTKPRIEREAFLRADEEAKRIGFEVLRSALLYPMNGGLGGL